MRGGALALCIAAAACQRPVEPVSLEVMDLSFGIDFSAVADFPRADAEATAVIRPATLRNFAPRYMPILVRGNHGQVSRATLYGSQPDGAVFDYECPNDADVRLRLWAYIRQAPVPGALIVAAGRHRTLTIPAAQQRLVWYGAGVL